MRPKKHPKPTELAFHKTAMANFIFVCYLRYD